jgi:transposase
MIADVQERAGLSKRAGAGAKAIVLEAVAQGLNVKDAAKRAKCSERAAYKWTTEPAFKAQMAELQAARRAEAESFLQAEIQKSLDTIRSLRDDDELDGGTRLRAAMELLDRAGLTKVDRSEVHVTQGQDVSDEDIDRELQRVALKLGGGE